MKTYDYVIVGSGLFAGVFAYFAKQKGKRCLVLEKRDHIGGNLYCEEIEGIQVHKYGAHIFHTSNQEVWDFVTGLVPFNGYINSPIANYKGEIYNLPFNMNTFSKMWGVTMPEEARKIIEQQRSVIVDEPKNLEEQAIRLVGTDLYEKLIKEYTKKQWGRSCEKLPGFIIKRLPVRYTYDNNYFNDRYQGIVEGGYNVLMERLFEGCEIRLSCDYLADKEYFDGLAKKVVYTGMIDAYYDYCFGELEYRSLQFDTKVLPEKNHQGVAVVNYTDGETKFTRIIEHKHFECENAFCLEKECTVVTKEYPATWDKGMEPYYPVNDARNQALYEQYEAQAKKEEHVIFGGRLAEYRYYDMDKVIESALACAKKEFE